MQVSKSRFIRLLMLINYSKIPPPPRALHKGQIVPWKGERKGESIIPVIQDTRLADIQTLMANNNVLTPALSATVGFCRNKPGEETSQAGTGNTFFINLATFRAFYRKGNVKIQIGQCCYDNQPSNRVKNKFHRIRKLN